MKLIEISAWNDSGGGFLHRLFDGHPQLDVWPFELLLGSHSRAPDRLSPDWFRGRFRWPRLENVAEVSAGALFDQISDAELKSVLEDPDRARHRAYPVDVSLPQWRALVEQRWALTTARRQSDFLQLYIESFFALEAPRRRPGLAVLGHCPTIVLDAAEIWEDFPGAQLIHVVRSPLAGFADMSRRHPDLVPEDYAQKWMLINTLATTMSAKYPERVKLVAIDQLIDDRLATLSQLCLWAGIDFDEIVLTPTWRGRPLDMTAMGPFGGVPSIRNGRDNELARALEPAVAERISASTLGARQLLKNLSEGVIDL
jgi:hypothetical protein